MAALSTQERAEVLRDIMRALSDSRAPSPLTKPQWAAAIAAADDWHDSAVTTRPATSYDDALPTAAKNNLSNSEKGRLYVAVAKKRWGG